MSNGTGIILSDRWDSIEYMPYWNWDKIVTTGDLRFLIKGFDNKTTEKEKENLDLYNKFLAEKRKEVNEYALSLLNYRERKYKKKLKDLKKQIEKDKEYKLSELNLTNHPLLIPILPELHSEWVALQQQHIDEFGVEDSLKERVRITKKLIALNAKFIRTGDRNILNFIKIEELKLNPSSENHFSMYKIANMIERNKRMDIDPKKVTVIKWFHALKSLIDGNTSKG